MKIRIGHDPNGQTVDDRDCPGEGFGLRHIDAGKKAAGSLLFWGRSQAGEAVRAVTNTGIVAQLNQAIAEGTARIDKGKTGLSRVGGMRRSVKTQVETAEAES